MTKQELENKYWHKFLVWCAKMPGGSDNELIFWLDHSQPTVDNFWEWLSRFRKEVLSAKS